MHVDGDANLLCYGTRIRTLKYSFEGMHPFVFAAFFADTVLYRTNLSIANFFKGRFVGSYRGHIIRVYERGYKVCAHVDEFFRFIAQYLGNGFVRIYFEVTFNVIYKDHPG